ncbi:hypothetical protein cypCar_00026970 [Cyprinus carpio]|nr:hypothetical protein cypCar_00026970 [Cyprinus carpio]
MVPVQDGASTQGENLLLPPKETQFESTGSIRQRQSSPARRMGMTRKLNRKDFKDSENPEESEKRHKEKELKPLYKELLYTITHLLGKTHTKEQYSAKQFQDYIKEAFSMTEDEHKTISEKVQSMLPPIYSLKVTVKQAKGILGKDISGFSDPYCLLSILCESKDSRGGGSSNKPQKAVVRGSAKGRVLQTTIKKQTLNPIWDETLKLEFEDISNANFHIEMWDKDEEVSLVQKLDEFRTNFHGLRRMIKEAKKEKGQDDFLGNVVLKLKDLHCTEDTWYNLEPRTETYPDRGQCHLQLKFIHKERDETLSAGRSPYVNYCGILQQLVQYHISKQQDSKPWKGDLCGEGTALLEHYASQNDISPFLQDLAKWVAYSKLYQSLEVDSTVLFQQITSIEYHWDQQELPNQQYGLCLVSKYRDIYPPTPKTTPRLQTLLRVLVQICKTRAFQKLNPAQFDLHVEVADAVVDGTEEWFNIKKGLHQPMTKDPLESISALYRLIGEVQEDIRLSKDVWNKVFVSAVQLDVFTVVYRKLDSLLNKDIETHVRSMASRQRLPSRSTEDAVVPLMKYLEKELQYMNENLVQENFNSLLTPLWMNSVKILHQMSTQGDSNMVYFQRLLYALQCLEQCFHAEGNGLSLETLHTEEYKTLRANLTQNSLSCNQLIEKFFERKVWEQKVFNGEKYGAVTLITSYKRSENKLHVEVLNAVNLIPLDSNGSSDPFVQLSLEPKHIFPQVEPRSTKIKSCDLNPLFEESFEFMITLEQCQSPGTCLLVTVLDHDTWSHDFEGEAFLSLKAVPGVGGGQQNPTPAQIRLPLMHPKPNSENTLKLLEARKGEREAQAFVKLRRQREKKSQET